MGKIHLHGTEYCHVPGVKKKKKRKKVHMCGHRKKTVKKHIPHIIYHILSDTGRENIPPSLDKINQLW